MIIICPNCDTRYQVAAKAIGSAGRKVQCASCQQSWQAFPVPEEEKPKPKLVVSTPGEPKKESDQIFDAADEASLDAEFNAEEQKTVAETGGPGVQETVADDGDATNESGDDAATPQDALGAGLGKKTPSNLRQQMRRRQDAFSRKLPMGRIRTQLRLLGAGLLIAVLVFGFQFRTALVRQFPDLAGLYQIVGLDVNVTGIIFKDTSTLRSLKNDAEVTLVSGRVQNISDRNVRVPPITVAILDEAGEVLYSWSVAPAVSTIGPGDVLDFETQLNNAPDGAHTVRLSLQSGRSN